MAAQNKKKTNKTGCLLGLTILVVVYHSFAHYRQSFKREKKNQNYFKRCKEQKELDRKTALLLTGASEKQTVRCELNRQWGQLMTRSFRLKSYNHVWTQTEWKISEGCTQFNRLKLLSPIIANQFKCSVRQSFLLLLLLNNNIFFFR